jgi:hypothetical protein
MSRWKAAGIHLLISILLIGAVAALIVYFWYPPALFKMANADRLLLIMGGIDLVIGPLLTLIIYKASKPSLRFDLSVIALLQIGFLGYGIYTIYQSRPVFLVAVPDRFELVFANEISSEQLAEAKIERFRHLSIGKPQLAGALMPFDATERDDILFSAVSGGGDRQTMPKYFVEYADAVDTLMQHAKPLKIDSDPTSTQKLYDAAQRYNRNPSELRYLILGSSREYAVMLVEAKTGAIIGPVDADP